MLVNKDRQNISFNPQKPQEATSDLATNLNGKLEPKIGMSK